MPAPPPAEPVAQEPPEPFFANFFAAEECADAGVDAVITSCGQALYNKYLSDKAYKFAAQTATDIMVAHLKMCFVQHDPGDAHRGDEEWRIEAEVPISELDSWCRRVVPVESRELPPPKEEAPKRRRSPKKKGAPVEEEKKQRGAKDGADLKPVKLPKPIREEDEYEDMLRKYKDREAARKKEADEERRRKQLEDEEKQRQLEKFKEELAKRQITYDSTGQIIFVNPPNVNKLPPNILSTGYKMKREQETPPPPPAKKTAGTRGRAKPKKPVKKREAPEFVDSFSRLTTLQPPAIEVMKLNAGVELEEHEKKKRGPPMDYPEGSMTRAGYRLLCDEDKSAPSEQKNASLGGSEDMASDVGGMTTSDAFNMEIVRMDPNLWGKNPPLLEQDLRQSTAQAPGTAHDYRQKREAVGNLGMHPRDRVAELGSTSGWRLPQPPLGATMGHGILRASASGRDELHFFPQQTPVLSPREARMAATGFATPPGSGRQVLPPLNQAPSLPALAQTQGSNFGWMDPGVMDVRFARSHSGGAITSSKSEMLKSMLR
jgi:hypothetical protein